MKVSQRESDEGQQKPSGLSAVAGQKIGLSLGQVP